MTITSFSNFEDSAVGQLIYLGGKTVVSIDWLAEEDTNSVGGTKDCAYAGIARVAGPASKARVLMRVKESVPEGRPRHRTRGEPHRPTSAAGWSWRSPASGTRQLQTRRNSRMYPSSTIDDASLHANSQYDRNEDEVWELGYAFDDDFDDLGDTRDHGPLR